MSLENLRRYYLDQPHEVAIETLAQCNAACTFCPYPTLERQGERMPDELLARLLDEMAGFRTPFYFSPFKVNEPLLDKRLIPLCERFERDARLGNLRIFSNGSALTDANIEGIAGLKRIAHLWVSLNSHDPDEYERLMGLKFDVTARRLDRLHAREFPHTVVLSAVGYPNAPFVAYCRERWPKFQTFVLRRTEWLGYTYPDDPTVPDTPCSRWFELSAMASGVVSLCCQDGEGKYPIGDLRRQTLLEVYNAPHWRERRERMLSRRLVYPCSTCSY